MNDQRAEQAEDHDAKDNVATIEPLSDDELEDVAGGWDGNTPPPPPPNGSGGGG